MNFFSLILSMNLVLVLTLAPFMVLSILRLGFGLRINPIYSVGILRLLIILCSISPIILEFAGTIFEIKSNLFNIELSPDTQLGSLLLIASQSNWQYFLTCCYLTFVVILFVGFARDFLVLIWLYKQTTRKVKMGRIDVRYSKIHTSPFVFGHPFGVTIIMPSGISLEDQWTTLRHEFSHIRNGDLGWNWAMVVFKPVFGWNPLFWLWKAAHDHYCEIKCDLETIKRYNIDKYAYLNSLISVAGAARNAINIPSYAFAFPGNMGLEYYRFRSRILDTLNAHHVKGSRLVLVTSLIMLLVGNVIGSSLDISARSWSLNTLTQDMQRNLNRGSIIAQNNAYGLVMSY